MEERWSDLARQLIWEMNPQTNYHGTPYSFNKFDDSKFLTGEGAMAHGPGHYSADDIKVAKGYATPSTYTTRNGIPVYNDSGPLKVGKKMYPKNTSLYPGRVIQDKQLKINNPKEFNERINNYKDMLRFHRNLKHSDYKSYKSGLDNLQKNLAFLLDIDNYDVIETQPNLYKVNVPNENFMWKEGLPLEQQNDYIKSISKNNKPFIDYSKYIGNTASQNRHILYKLDLDKHKDLKRLADLFLRLDSVYPSGFNDKHRQLMIRMLNKLPFDEQRDLLNYFRGNSDKPNVIPDMQKLYGNGSGIKGIRARGTIDGPINVTFTGDDIRMANTPWQRFINRIPTKTLGKMANKLIESPAIRFGGKLLNRVATPMMILEGLSQPVGEGSDIVPQYPVNNTLRGYIYYNE